MSHAEQMDAAAYWRNYETKVSWEKDGQTVVGTLEALRETRTSPKDPWTPRLAIRTPDGFLTIVDAYQQRLLAELVLHKPAVGDKVRITYLGPDERAPGGRSPVKRFRVEVWPQGSQTPAGTGAGTSGDSETPENAPGSGK